MSKFVPGQSGNASGRPPGTRNRLSAAFDGVLTDKDREAVLRKLIEKAKDGDSASISMILDRCWPRLRPQSAAVQIDFSGAESLSDKAEAVTAAVATGKLPADVGGELLQALAAIAQLQRFTEMEERMERIEYLLSKPGAKP